MKFCLRFEVLTVVSMNIQAFRRMMPCRLVYRHFGINIYLHLQGLRSPRGQNEISLTVEVLLYSISGTVKMKAEATLNVCGVVYQNTCIFVTFNFLFVLLNIYGRSRTVKTLVK